MWKPGGLPFPGLPTVFFPLRTDGQELADYLRRVLACIGGLPSAEDGAAPARVLFGDRSIHLCQCRYVASGQWPGGYGAGLFIVAEKNRCKASRIPYEGEPLSGIQVMGILETRNLDFENVLILSANDDTFPGNLAAGASFIPHNLRLCLRVAYAACTMKEFMPITFTGCCSALRVVHICSTVPAATTSTPANRAAISINWITSRRTMSGCGLRCRLSVKPSPRNTRSQCPKLGEVADAAACITWTAGGRTFSPTSFYAIYRMSPQILFPQY